MTLKQAKKILNENKPKLVHLAEELIAKETLEGEELEAAFSGAAPPPSSKAAAKPAPVPAKAATKTKTKPARKKAPLIPTPFPEQAPATPD